MKIMLFNNRLYTLNLPAKIDGSFSLQDIPNSEEVLANIEENENKWVMNTTQDFKIFRNNQFLNSVEIKPYEFYVLNSNNIKKLVYADVSSDNSFKMFRLNGNSQFIIGKSNNCQIYYNNEYLLEQHIVISFSDGNWICQLAPKASVYINRNLTTQQNIKLKNGDILFLYGLKIIIMNNIIMINNPNNSVRINAPFLQSFDIRQEEREYDEPKEIDYYDENDYFFKTPRLRRFIETYELNFANPPAINQDEDMPLILTLGPALTMGVMSIANVATTIISIATGKATIANSWSRFLMAFAMIAGSLVWPNIMKKYNKKRKAEMNKKREEKYHAYLEKKKQEMISEGVNQSAILKENLMPLSECFQTIVNRKRILWERKISQKDFLTVRVGTGDVPIDMDIKFNEDEFQIDEDPLKDDAQKIVDENKNLIGVPVGYSFFNKKATAIMGMDEKLYPFLYNIILQLITFHSYDDLKIVIFTDKQRESKWEIFKNLPHCFSNNKSVRFFATDTEELKTVSSYLEQELIGRANTGEDAVENEDRENSTTFSPYYLIFTDCFSKVRRLGISELILKNKPDFGFGFVMIENSLGKLPSECNNFITLGNQTSGILTNELDNYHHQDFNDEIDTSIDLEKCCEVLANIPIEFYEDVRFLPKALGFLEMQKVGKVEQLNSLNRWRLNDPTKSLRAGIGINDMGNIIYLDLHEKYHGPHGLIAGTTGSGKSEFIITYILSMALNYSPDEVSFILIDYKGGGLAGAFENKTQNIRLPHLAGTITNLDKSELNRTLVSINSELKRRQKVFNEARDKLGESTIDIYKYQKFFRQKKLSEPIPHLFIISDEFAELKAQQPEFMDNLISTARIGRSLGVHLILATQKPSGVVNDQIWSNTKFRVCLKVQDKSDSNEMIKKPDAADIKEAGRFYLQVGNDELFLYGQSGWAGTQYVPSDTVNTEIDRSISYLDNVAASIKEYDDSINQPKVSSLGDELSNVLKYICALAKREKLESPRLWLDNIPGTIYTESLMNKYNFVPEKNKLVAILGEYDDPSNQRQDLLTLELGNNGNTMIYGTQGANREMLLNTLIYSLCINHTSDEVNIYIFDFGSEALRMFTNMPHVGDIVYASDEEKVVKLNRMIYSEIAKRKALFADYNGEYENYCRNSGKTLPRKIFIYNNLDSYREIYPNFDEDLVKVSREGLRYGIIIIITASSSAGIYSRVLRNFENIFVLDMPNRDNYITILGKIGNIYPADIDGRGLFKGEIAYEYQTAQIYPKDKLVEYIKKKIIEIKEKNPNKAESIPVLPEIITLDTLKEDNITFKNIPVGIYKDSLAKAYYNFETDKNTLVCANEIETLPRFLSGLVQTIKLVPLSSVVLLDFENIMENYKKGIDTYVNNNFADFLTKFNEQIEGLITSDKVRIMIIILGIDKFKSSIDAKIFNDFISVVKKLDNVKLITADSSYKYKKYTFESWCTETVVNANGIWIGNGAGDQTVIRASELNKKYRARISNDFIWIFKNGNGDLAKCINDLGDNNEK